MIKFRKLVERFVEGVFTVSGAVTSIAILLIIVFLFKEGFGILNTPAIDKNYAVYIHSDRKIKQLSTIELKNIFDEDVTNWKQLGDKDEPIKVFRLSDLFEIYQEEEFGGNYELLPGKIKEVLLSNPDIIAYLPTKYVPEDLKEIKALPPGDISFTDYFLGYEWMPTATPAPLFGVLPLILGTLLVSLAAILIALPLGLGVAIFLSELADDRIRGFMKPAIELLSGIPSVVYGFFGLVVIVPLIRKVLDLPVGETALAGSIILAIMALPTIITVAEDAMRNTPRSMREASLALGANKWQTIYKVVIPYSISGISAAVVLGTGRAIGETMAVLMVTGNAAVMPASLLEPVRTIPATIAAELGEAPAGGAHYQALFMLGCILFLITMIISLSAEAISKRHPNKGL
jgi:phosphate transport system permease protein